MSSRNDMTWGNLLDDEAEDIASAARRLFDRAAAKTALGSGNEISGIGGNSRALAAMALLLVRERRAPPSPDLEARLQRSCNVGPKQFRAALGSLRQVLGFYQPSLKRSPRKNAARTLSSPLKSPTKRMGRAGGGKPGQAEDEDEDDDDDDSILRTPTKRKGRVEGFETVVRASRGRAADRGGRSEAARELMRGSRTAVMPLETTGLCSPASRKRPASARSRSPSPTCDAPQLKRNRTTTTPGSSPRKRAIKRTTPPPPQPMSIFDSSRGYVPVPSKATAWQRKGWYIDKGDWMWMMDEEDRGPMENAWDEWQRTVMERECGWGRPANPSYVGIDSERFDP